MSLHSMAFAIPTLPKKSDFRTAGRYLGEDSMASNRTMPLFRKFLN